jgi:hypothetical protein
VRTAASRPKIVRVMTPYRRIRFKVRASNGLLAACVAVISSAYLSSPRSARLALMRCSSLVGVSWSYLMWLCFRLFKKRGWWLLTVITIIEQRMIVDTTGALIAPLDMRRHRSDCIAAWRIVIIGARSSSASVGFCILPRINQHAAHRLKLCENGRPSAGGRLVDTAFLKLCAGWGSQICTGASP